VIANAATHRPDSRKKFYVRTRDEYIKALDEGHAIEIGIPWYSGYNMGGGFSAPWIIEWGKGVMVGGHAILIKGYKDVVIGANGTIFEALMRTQNSYSKNWGEGGDFYIKLTDLVRNGVVGMVEVDMDDQSTSELIKQFEGKMVKGKNPGIFLIQNGLKRAFPSAECFFTFGGRYGKYGKNYIDINQSTLDSIPEGEAMQIQDSPYWNLLITKGITLEFLDSNRDVAQVWGDNPKTLQAIVEAMRGLLPPVFNSPVSTPVEKVKSIFETIKSLFNK
jgi:hypothetical protein